VTRSRIPAPNYTQAPNVLLDELLPEIGTLAELKVTLVVVRHTIGWHEDERKLSLSELEERTGLSRRSVIDGIKAGLERGTIERRIEGPKGAEQAFYCLDLAGADSSPGLVKELHQDQESIFTSASADSSPASIERKERPKESSPNPLASEGADLTNDDQAKWAKVLDECRSQVSETTMSQYVDRVELVGRRGDTLVLQAPDEVASWVRKRFLPLLERMAALHFGPTAEASLPMSETERARTEREQLLDRRPATTVRERRRRRSG
jgi:hypothetical protein